MAAPMEETNHAAGSFDDEEDDLDTEDSDMEEYEDDANPNANHPQLDLQLEEEITHHNGSSIPIQIPIESPNPNPPVTPLPAPTPAPSSAGTEESRRLFQRLWTDDDEIKILSGFLEFTSSRGTTYASHQYDTGPFYEQIKNQLQLDFNKNQLIEKLRRMKKKYRNTASRMANHGPEFSFKTPHEKATFEIARRIWSAGIKRSRESDDDLDPYANHSADAAAVSSERRVARSTRRRGRKRAVDMVPMSVPLMLTAPPPAVAFATTVTVPEDVVKVEVQQTAPPPVITPSVAVQPLPSLPSVPNVIEETMRTCLSPIFKELMNAAVSVPIGLGMNNGLPGLGLGFGADVMFNAGDEKWRKQQILELEVYLKRVELVKEQIVLKLEELRSAEPATADGS